MDKSKAIISNVKAKAALANQSLPSDKALRAQARDKLVLNSIQLQLADRMGIQISDAHLDSVLQSIAANNNVSVDAFRQQIESEGQSFERVELERALKENPGIEWIWGTHCETSTGVLNDIEMYKQVCAGRGGKLCMDCISSIGPVPVDLSGVYLASGTSGKGVASI